MLKNLVIGTTLIYEVVMLYLVFKHHFSIVYVFSGLLFFIGMFIWGVFDIRLSFFIPVIFKSPNHQPKTVALTFDDGPTKYTSEILDLLQLYQAKATFFCVGKQIEKYPEIAKRILAEGHTIGNHSYSHPNKMGFLTTNKVKEEIQKCDKVLQDILTIQTPFYRPPFGITNPHIAKAIGQTRHSVIGWNNRSLDTVIKNPNTIFNRIYKRLERQTIVLMHDTSNNSVEVLNILLKQSQKDNYKYVNLVEFLNSKKQ